MPFAHVEKLQLENLDACIVDRLRVRVVMLHTFTPGDNEVKNVLHLQGTRVYVQCATWLFLKQAETNEF